MDQVGNDLHTLSQGELSEDVVENVLNVVQSLTEQLKIEKNRFDVEEEVLCDVFTLLDKICQQSDGTRLLLLATEVFRCLRNVCAGCPRNQDRISSQGTLFEETVSYLNDLLLKLQSDEKVAACLRCGVQFLGNAVNGCDANTAVVWRLMSHKFCDYLRASDEHLAKYSCMVLYSCLSADRCHEVMTSDHGGELVSSVLQLLMKNDVDWSLFITERLLGCENFLDAFYKGMSIEERTLVLDVIFSMLEKVNPPDDLEKKTAVSNTNILFLVEEFITEAHIILKSTHADSETTHMEPSVVVKTLDVLCAASYCPSLNHDIQKKVDLLKCAINLLHCLHMIGQEGDNAFSAVQKISEQSSVDQSHPGYGLKKDLIRLIGNMCHRHRENQDAVREMGGIGLILNHTSIDGRNPYITQWSVFAVHNLCEDNLDNQAVIAGMKVEGVSNSSELLQQFGVRATVKEDKIVINKE